MSRDTRWKMRERRWTDSCGTRQNGFGYEHDSREIPGADLYLTWQNLMVVLTVYSVGTDIAEQSNFETLLVSVREKQKGSDVGKFEFAVVLMLV